MREFAGLLSIHSHGESDEILFLSSLREPLAQELNFMQSKNCTVRYWITDKKATKDEAQDAFIGNLFGVADIDFGANYSEYTGYLWTDEEIKVGGHDLLDELKTNVGKWLILEIECEGKDTTHADK